MMLCCWYECCYCNCCKLSDVSVDVVCGVRVNVVIACCCVIRLMLFNRWMCLMARTMLLWMLMLPLGLQ